MADCVSLMLPIPLQKFGSDVGEKKEVSHYVEDATTLCHFQSKVDREVCNCKRERESTISANVSA